MDHFQLDFLWLLVSLQRQFFQLFQNSFILIWHTTQPILQYILDLKLIIYLINIIVIIKFISLRPHSKNLLFREKFTLQLVAQIWLLLVHSFLLLVLQSFFLLALEELQLQSPQQLNQQTQLEQLRLLLHLTQPKLPRQLSSQSLLPLHQRPLQPFWLLSVSMFLSLNPSFCPIRLLFLTMQLLQLVFLDQRVILLQQVYFHY